MALAAASQNVLVFIYFEGNISSSGCEVTHLIGYLANLNSKNQVFANYIY